MTGMDLHDPACLDQLQTVHRLGLYRKTNGRLVPAQPAVQHHQRVPARQLILKDEHPAAVLLIRRHLLTNDRRSVVVVSSAALGTQADGDDTTVGAETAHPTRHGHSHRREVETRHRAVLHDDVQRKRRKCDAHFEIGGGGPNSGGVRVGGEQGGKAAVSLDVGLEKTRVFLIKKKTAHWLFCVFWVFYIFAQKREFYGFFSFKKTFRCIQTNICISS
jgi:hypothetical protein